MDENEMLIFFDLSKSTPVAKWNIISHLTILQINEKQTSPLESTAKHGRNIGFHLKILEVGERNH